jgi:hypothetical protein
LATALLRRLRNEPVCGNHVPLRCPASCVAIHPIAHASSLVRPVARRTDIRARMSWLNERTRRIKPRENGDIAPLGSYYWHLIKAAPVDRWQPRPKGNIKMNTDLQSYVSRVLFATPSPDRVLGATAQRWRRLTASLFDPYRPELHYMRGPGPKWREKHARGAG